MATQRYNPTTLADPTGDAAQLRTQAEDRLRRRLIVNKFTGASAAENLPTGITAARHISISTDIDVDTAGHYVFINRTVEFEAGGSIRASVNGVHIYFFNCNLIFHGTNNENGDDSQLATQDDAVSRRGYDVDISNDIALHRSINFYGCNYQVAEDSAGAFHWIQGDCFDTSFVWGDDGIFLPSTYANSRMVNVTFFSRRGALDVMELYGIPAVVEGVIFDGLTWEFVNNVTTVDFLLTNPQFTDSTVFEGTQEQRFRLNHLDSDATFKCIGFQAPVDNTAAKAFATGDGDNVYVRGSSTGSGGVLLMYGWRPEFYEDQGDTGIGGVRVRVASSVPLQSDATAGSAFPQNDASSTRAYGSQSASIVPGTAVNQTGETKNLIHEYLSVAGTATDDFRGKCRLGDGLVRVTRDGGTTWREDQHVNWGRIRKEEAPTTAIDAFYINYNDQQSAGAALNVIASPMAYIGQNRLRQYETSYEARSYTHEVHEAEELQNGIVSADGAGATQVADTLVAIGQRRVIGAQRRPALLAATEAVADAEFDGRSNKTPQQMYDYLVSQWAQYNQSETFELVTVTGQDLTINDRNFTIFASDSGTPASNINSMADSLTIGSINNIVASGAGEVVRGIQMTGTNSDITLMNNVGTMDVNFTTPGSITIDNATHSGVFTAGTNITFGNSTFRADTTLRAEGTITGEASSVLSDGLTIDGDITGIPGVQYAGVTLTAGHNVTMPDTGTVVLTGVMVEGTGDITINQVTDQDLTVQVPGGLLSRFTGGTNVTIEAIPHSARFTHEPIPGVSGRFIVMRRATAGTGDWTEYMPAVNVGAGDQGEFLLPSNHANVGHEFLLIWRPYSIEYNTAFRIWDGATSFPTSAEDVMVTNNPLTSILREIPTDDSGRSLETLSDPVNSGFTLFRYADAGGTNAFNVGSIQWSTITISDGDASTNDTELQGVLLGTQSRRSTNLETKIMLLNAYTSESYFTTLVNNINEIYTTGISSLDYITPASVNSTNANGSYVQLTAGGDPIQQQRVTAVTNTSSTPNNMVGVITSDIEGTETTTSTDISFPAVDIADNPAGISVAEVRAALAGSFMNQTTDINAHTTAQVDRVTADLGAHDDAISSQTIHGRINLVSDNVNRVSDVADNIDSNLVEVNDNVIVASVKPAAVQTAQDGADTIEALPPL